MVRNLLLINMQINTSLRACDTLALRVGDIFKNGRFLDKFWLEQKKTKEQVGIKIFDCIRDDLEYARVIYQKHLSSVYFDDPENPLFPSYRHGTERFFKPISYSMYLKLVKDWVEEIGLNRDMYGTHSLRVSLPLAVYKKIHDTSLVKEFLGHSCESTTQIYLKQIAKVEAQDSRENYLFTDF